MRSAIIRKASQDKQQNQTKTTNINYIQNLSPLFKKRNIINKVKIASNKTENNQINLYITRKKNILNHSIIKLGNN